MFIVLRINQVNYPKMFTVLKNLTLRRGLKEHYLIFVSDTVGKYEIFDKNYKESEEYKKNITSFLDVSDLLFEKIVLKPKKYLERTKMAAELMNENGVLISSNYPTCMESVNRISRLPVVESTIQTATNIYEKVKDYNSVTNWTLSTAESTVNMAVEVGKPIATPVIKNLEGPIKKVDTVLCSGLDYVESKMPAVKLPPSEIYTTTKDYVTNHVTPAVESARSYAEPAIGRARSAMDAVEPALERARNAVEPAMERAKSAMEPALEMARGAMEPALERAHALKENVMQKVDEYLHRGHEHDGHEGDALECEECKEVKQKLIEEEEKKQQQQHAQSS